MKTLTPIIREWLTNSGGSDRAGELCYNFFTNDLSKATWIPDCDSYSPALFYLFISSHASICSTMVFSPLRHFDHVVSVLIDFPSNSKGDAPFHHIAYNYSGADWEGLHDHLRDVPREYIFKVGASAAASEFCDWIQIGIDVISGLTHFHGFWLLVLLP